jgi:hypothetical protein
MIGPDGMARDDAGTWNAWTREHNCQSIRLAVTPGDCQHPLLERVGMVTLFEQLAQLVETFDRDIQLAKSVDSPNEEVELAIKAAIIGFSYTSSTDEWAKEHFEFVKARIESDYSTEQLAEYGENSENVRLFFALAIGYLLGVNQKGGISDQAFNIAAVQIPGLIMLHLGRLTAHPV